MLIYMQFTLLVCCFYVVDFNFIHISAIWEEGNTVQKLPLSDWLVNMSEKHFLFCTHMSIRHRQTHM